ncbi:unnamed protein product [Gadus morhua 'NCC']
MERSRQRKGARAVGHGDYHSSPECPSTEEVLLLVAFESQRARNEFRVIPIIVLLHCDTQIISRSSYKERMPKIPDPLPSVSGGPGGPLGPGQLVSQRFNLRQIPTTWLCWQSTKPAAHSAATRQPLQGLRRAPGGQRMGASAWGQRVGPAHGGQRVGPACGASSWGPAHAGQRVGPARWASSLGQLVGPARWASPWGPARGASSLGQPMGASAWGQLMGADCLEQPSCQRAFHFQVSRAPPSSERLTAVAQPWVACGPCCRSRCTSTHQRGPCPLKKYPLSVVMLGVCFGSSVSAMWIHVEPKWLTLLKLLQPGPSPLSQLSLRAQRHTEC